jgi:hypothetical protein
VYQKLRQQWIRTSMAELQVMRLQTEETEDQDGWTD